MVIEQPVQSFPNLKILFVAARVVGYRCLEAVLRGGANVVGLFTLDPCMASATTAYRPFNDLVDLYGLRTWYFTALDTPYLVEAARDLKPDLGIVIGVSQLIPPSILSIPPLGFVGMHPTLLPEGRGRAPIPWAIIKGLKRTGVTLFYLDSGPDTGDILAQVEIPIYYEDTAASLGERTDHVAACLLVEYITRLARGTAPRTKQDESRATVWERRRPEDGLIDWSKGRRQLYDWVRGLTHPYPGAFTYFKGRKLYIWAARESWDERVAGPGKVAAITPQGILVGTGDGMLLVTNLQPEGEGKLHAQKWAEQVGLAPGDVFSTQ